MAEQEQPKETVRRALRLILNGKSAALEPVREAVLQLREQGHRVDVRVTWEQGDAARYAEEAALAEDIDVVVAGGGDGTVHEVINGLFQAAEEPAVAVAILPLGTANDFAAGCSIPIDDPLQALTLAAEGPARRIDVGRVNDQFFVNVASGGFGAEVTARTSPDLKKMIGAAAYALTGLVTALQMNPYHAKLMAPGVEHEGEFILLAVGNGRQAGGGYQVAPRALLDDGLLDLMAVPGSDLLDLAALAAELDDLGNPESQLVFYRQVPTLRIESEEPIHFTLDGEPYQERSFQFQVLPGRLRFILPPRAPLSRKP